MKMFPQKCEHRDDVEITIPYTSFVNYRFSKESYQETKTSIGDQQGKIFIKCYTCGFERSYNRYFLPHYVVDLLTNAHIPFIGEVQP